MDMNSRGIPVFVFCIVGLNPGRLAAQAADTGQTKQSSLPATKLEAFQPVAGQVTTLGYDPLGTISPGVTVPSTLSVDVRQIQGVSGGSVRGVVVEISTSLRTARSFVDEDELPELMKGIDALLTVKSNPTSFASFEIRYRTKGDLVLTVFNTGGNRIRFAITAGRVLSENRTVDESEFRRFRDWIEKAQTKLASTPPK
jgi:hypothetical protein